MDRFIVGEVNINIPEISAESTLTAILKEPNTAVGVNLGDVTVKSNGTVDVPLPKNENTNTFGIRLSSKPTANVTIRFTGVDSTEGTFSTSSLTFTPENWDRYQSVTVTGVDDSSVDGDIMYTVIAKASSTDPQYNNDNVSTSIAITNLDDDNLIQPNTTTNSSTGPIASITSPTTREITEGSAITLTVNLTQP